MTKTYGPIFGVDKFLSSKGLSSSLRILANTPGSETLMENKVPT
jgi:hypothetical protein